MSSLVSLRSRERRKSAGARLQTSSQCDYLSRAPEKNLKQELRLSSQLRAGPGIPELHARVPRRRVKSALETRKEQEASNIFNRQEKVSPPVDPKWGVTKYSEDFGPKRRITPIPMRPTSSTRRNNPHPSKAFMIWQFPLRTHKHHKAVPPPPDSWRYIQEGFYEDYRDNYNTGDAKNEVPITNVAKIKFPGSLEGHSLAKISGAHCHDPLSGVSGTKAHIIPRKRETSTKKLRPVSPQSRMIKGTVKDSSLPVVKEWLKIASSKERELILQMLQAGYDNSEDVRLSKALDSVFRPESVEKVQNWLQNSSESERKIVLNVLETLAIAADDHPSSSYTIQNYHMDGVDNYYQSKSYPVTLRPKKSASHHQSSPFRGQSPLQDYKRQSETGQASSSSSTTGTNCKGFGLHGKKMMIQSTREERDGGSDLRTEIWHNRVLPRHTGATITHAGGIFGQPKKDRGQHFTHHPEWPTA